LLNNQVTAYERDEIHDLFPDSVLYRSGKGRSLRFAFFVPHRDEELRRKSMRYVGAYLSLGNEIAPVSVFVGAAGAPGWEAVP
jgi:hypothetical protein